MIFSFSKIQDALNVNGTIIPDTDFSTRFQQYQYCLPGLNYRIACDNQQCQGSTELVILNRGFGQFDLSDRVLCPICLNFLNNPVSIKNLIFFQAEVIIHIGLADSFTRSKKYFANGGQLLLLGDETRIENYSCLRINVKKTTDFLEHRSLIPDERGSTNYHDLRGSCDETRSSVFFDKLFRILFLCLFILTLFHSFKRTNT